MSLINGRELHVVLLTRNYLDCSVPPCLNSYFSLDVSVHTVSTRRCNDMGIPKVSLEVDKRSFYLTGAMEFNGLPCHIESKESSIEFSRDTRTFSLIR